jgi:hypothetical protein
MIDLRFVPLTAWPGEPTKERKNAAFRSAYLKTLDLLETELKAIKARSIVIEAFYTLEQIRNDGWPRANQNPSHPGVILGFKKPDGPVIYREQKPFVNIVPLSFPCDTYYHIEHNIHAIALSLQALRAVDRYGVTKRAEQYAGWKRIEAPKATGFKFNTAEDAAAFIVNSSDPASVPNDVRREAIANATWRQEVYRRAARRLHPDSATGDHELFVKLQQANAMLEGH